MSAAPVTLVIDSVGARGDGIARHDGRPVYVPFAAPGDRIAARLGESRGEGRAAELVAVLAPGERATPVCRHFGSCGGCALQHLSERAYVEAKEQQVAAALRQHALEAEVLAPLCRVPPGTRRRARFSLKQPRRGAAAVGFNARMTHQIVDMRACAVLDPAIVALVPPLRALAPRMFAPGGAGAATVTLADTDIDLLLDLPDVPDLARLEALAAFAEAQDLARLGWRAPGAGAAVPVAIRRPPRIAFAGVAVDLPDDAFLQASAAAEALLVAEVMAGIGPARRIADLHAGLGTFSFALASRATVHAVDGSRPAVSALAAAAMRAALPQVTAACRDLEARPLLPDELANFDAVVLDPPRAGARAQSAALALSRVPRIVAVSCNPASFARDARLLIDGGYRLTRVQPVDQFVWSPHVELVAWFERSGVPLA